MTGATFSCPQCGKALRNPPPLPAGKKIKCPSCAAIFLPPVRAAEELAAKARRSRDEDDEDSIQDKPRPKKRAVIVDDGDEDDDFEDRPRGKKGRERAGNKGLLIGGIALVVVLLLAGGGIGAYFLWFADSSTHRAGSEKDRVVQPPAETEAERLLVVANTGRADEDSLAFVPAGTEGLLGIDLAALMKDKDAKPLIEQLLQLPELKADPSIDAGLALIDKLSKENGMDRSDLAAQIVFATKADLGGAGGGMPGGMPAGPMPGPMGGGMPGGMPGGGMMPPGGAAPQNAKTLTLILRSGKDFDQKKIAESFPERSHKSAHDKSYYALSGGAFKTLFMPSNRTLVLSTQPGAELDALFNSDGQTPNLSAEAASLVRRVNKNTLWGAVLFEGQLKVQLALLVALGGVTPEQKALLDPIVAGHGGAFGAALDADRLTLSVEVSCADDAGATQLTQAVEKEWKGQAVKLGLVMAAQTFSAPKTVKLYMEATKSLKFTAEGTFAKVSLGVSRATLVNAIAEIQKQMADEKAKAAGGKQPPPFKPDKPKPGGANPPPAGVGKAKPGPP